MVVVEDIMKPLDGVKKYSLLAMDVNLEGSMLYVMDGDGVVFGDRLYMRGTCGNMVDLRDFRRVLFEQDGATLKGRVWCYGGEEEYKSILKVEVARFIETNIA